ncbi:MAG: hypothetical protein HQL82_05165 [Magnetococcales bacterium]|nr:hypothetical protein [Magnetococcales bacterium]
MMTLCIAATNPEELTCRLELLLQRLRSFLGVPDPAPPKHGAELGAMADSLPPGPEQVPRNDPADGCVRRKP